MEEDRFDHVISVIKKSFLLFPELTFYNDKSRQNLVLQRNKKQEYEKVFRNFQKNLKVTKAFLKPLYKH